MEFYRLTIPIPKQPWLWIRFRIGTILLLIAILAIMLAWRRDHRDLTAEVRRLRNPAAHYEAAQATGEPDVDRQGDSSRAWCPATVDSGNEWLQLKYDSPITPTAILLHENYSTGAVVRVTSVPIFGRETTLWEGTYTPSSAKGGAVAKLPVSVATTTDRIKVYLKTSQAAGWEEIDAVGLVDANGEVHWASGATASSTWGDVIGSNQSSNSFSILESLE